MRPSYFITGIDTDAGKSIVTGLLARFLLEKGVRVITQKMAQTGGSDFSHDIATHRSIMRSRPFPEDETSLTCPYLFAYPASPHLAAEMEGRCIEPETIHAACEELSKRYSCVLTEGVGGLMVPLQNELTVLDYMVRFPQPTVLVTHGKLGSINHTLLTLEVCKQHNIRLVAVIYNHGISGETLINVSSRNFIREKSANYYPDAAFIEIPFWKEDLPTPDFSPIFEK